MARARNIKPAFFKNEVLGTRDPFLMILFEGLWCLADREGRVEDRPLRINAEIFPYRNFDEPTINGYLTELASLDFIHRYEVRGVRVIQVIKFSKHQSPHKTEKPSELPSEPVDNKQDTDITVKASLSNGALTEQERPDLLIPDSLNTDSLVLVADVREAGETENGRASAQRFISRHPPQNLDGHPVSSEPDDMQAFGTFRDLLEDWWCQVKGGMKSMFRTADDLERVTWLFENGFTVDEIKACYTYLTTDPREREWRRGRIQMTTIIKEIPDWKLERKAADTTPVVVDFSFCTDCDEHGYRETVDAKGVVRYGKCKHEFSQAAA
jgi:hypothetical protein